MDAFFSTWLETFCEHASKEHTKMKCALLSVLSSHATGADVLVPYPEAIQNEEQLTEEEFLKGLEEAKKQGWLGSLRWAFGNQAILITLAIPEGLAGSVASSD